MISVVTITGFLHCEPFRDESYVCLKTALHHTIGPVGFGHARMISSDSTGAIDVDELLMDFPNLECTSDDGTIGGQLQDSISAP